MPKKNRYTCFLTFGCLLAVFFALRIEAVSFFSFWRKKDIADSLPERPNYFATAGKYFFFSQKETRTNNMRAGTSTNGPITPANA